MLRALTEFCLYVKTYMCCRNFTVSSEKKQYQFILTPDLFFFLSVVPMVTGSLGVNL